MSSLSAKRAAATPRYPSLQEIRAERERRHPPLMNLSRGAGIEPDPWQGDLLQSDARQMILLCSRQSGKSTVSSLLALGEAVYRPESLVLLLSPSLRQSSELFRKVKDAYLVASRQMLHLPKATDISTLRMELSNDSRIVSLPGKEETIRGFSGVSLLVVDEASRVPDALYQAVRPMLAVSGGRIILLSTPFGKRGFFHHEWEDGGDRWHRAKITAYDCPRIPKDWLEAERVAIGDYWFRQEYLVEFVDTIDQVFGYEYVMGAISDELEPFLGG